MPPKPAKAGDVMAAPGGKQEASIEERQASIAIQARQRGAAKRRKAREAKDSAQADDSRAPSPPGAPRARTSGAGFASRGGAGSPKDGAAPSGQARGVELQKRMREHDHAAKEKSAREAREATKSPELRAAELVQRLWRARQERLGRSVRRRVLRRTPQSLGELDSARSAALIQAQARGAMTRRRADGLAYAGRGEAAVRAKAEAERARAARVMIRFHRTFCRKRNARRWVKEEKGRREAAAATLQAAARGRRIRKYVGYRGSTEAEHGRPHGFGRMVWPNGASYEGEWVDGLQQVTRMPRRRTK